LSLNGYRWQIRRKDQTSANSPDFRTCAPTEYLSWALGPGVSVAAIAKLAGEMVRRLGHVRTYLEVTMMTLRCIMRLITDSKRASIEALFNPNLIAAKKPSPFQRRGHRKSRGYATWKQCPTIVIASYKSIAVDLKSEPIFEVAFCPEEVLWLIFKKRGRLFERYFNLSLWLT